MNELFCYFCASNPVLTVDASLSLSLDAPEDRVNSHGAENHMLYMGLARSNGSKEEVESGGLHGGGVAQAEFVVGRLSAEKELCTLLAMPRPYSPAPASLWLLLLPGPQPATGCFSRAARTSGEGMGL